MQPISPESSPDRFSRVMLPLTVGVASALLVFSVLVFAFGDTGSTVALPPTPTTDPNGSTSTTRGGSGQPGAPRVVKSAVNNQGEVVSLVVTMGLGDELRLKVVPEAAFDPQVGITMPTDQLETDYVQKGYKGDVQRLFPIQNGLLYGDTLTPSATVALEANDLGKEGAAEWLVFVAPTAADYSVVVRGRGTSAGSYALTVQTRNASARAIDAPRLDANAGWLTREAVAEIARDDLPFLNDASFYADPEFRTDGSNTGPTKDAIETLITTGA